MHMFLIVITHSPRLPLLALEADRSDVAVAGKDSSAKLWANQLSSDFRNIY